MFIFFICLLLSVVFILVRIAFFTLLERKGLAYSQRRLGPNKYLYGGVIQPLLDALKLLTKKVFVPHQISSILFFIVPGVFFFLIILMWFSFPGLNSSKNFSWGLFLFIRISGFSSILLLIMGITSFSKFGVLGGLRGVSQGVSYEIIFSIIIFSQSVFFFRRGVPERFLTPGVLIFFFWFLCILAEANRAPFDFTEGERELIRGFNVEYRGGPFVFIFLGEYGFILGVRFLRAKIFFFNTLFFSSLIFFAVIIFRGLFPRFRYDFLIGMCWFTLIPIILFWCGSVLIYKS